MDSLYLLQFASSIFMLVNAGFIGLSSLHVRWENRRYECSRWMLFTALVGLAVHYLLQMHLGIRAAGDDLGAIVNMLAYTPCFTLFALAIYNIETLRSHRYRMIVPCVVLYAAIIVSFGIGYHTMGGYHIGLWLYVMLFFYVVCSVYNVSMIIREIQRRRRMLETMTAADMLPYVRYSHSSVFILSIASLFMPVAILSTTLLYIIGPLVLLAFLFFNITFISLGSSYIPTDELLYSEEDSCDEPNSDAAAIGEKVPNAEAEQSEAVQSGSAESRAATLSDNRIGVIRQSLEAWCADCGYKDSSVNMLTLSRSLNISKVELSQYFDQYLGSNFRVWLSDIRFQAAKKMMLSCPDYSNDVVSAECGFSSRTHLYRVFKVKEGCTPTVWRGQQSKALNDDVK